MFGSGPGKAALQPEHESTINDSALNHYALESNHIFPDLSKDYC